MVNNAYNFPAKDTAPAPYGLLSVADVVRPTSDTDLGHWLYGDYDAELNSRPQKVSILAGNNTAVTGGQVYASGVTSSDFYIRSSPFYIEVVDNSSAMGILAEDRFSRIRLQIEAATQKAVEFELWNGPGAVAGAISQSYLTRTGGATALTTAGVHPRRALMLLEQSIATSPTGATGTIHLTRDVASVLTSTGSIIESGGHLFTGLGTPVVVGSGYSGNGPVGTTAAAATTDNKWAYVTGPVTVLLGKAEIDNEDMARAFKPYANDVFLKATRPAAIHFDPTIFFTAQITLPAIP